MLLPLICVALIALSGWAQQRGAEVTGVVKDSSGAVIPGAEITLTNQLSGVRKVTLTNEAGFYRAIDLNPGSYRIEEQMTGFRPSAVRVVLETSKTSTVDMTLEVGQLTEQVTVTDKAVVLETQSHTISNLI